MHGYDVVDHSRLSEPAGGRPAFDRLSARLADHRMGAIADNAELLTAGSDMAFEEKVQSLMDSRGFSRRDPAKAIADRHRANKKD